MNYYIQGDAANADKIKAAFEKEGYDVKGWAFTSGIYYTLNGKIINTNFASNEYKLVLNNPDYKELELPVEPNFKVGNWITDGISKCQVHFIDNTQYWYSEDNTQYWYSKNCILGSIESVNKRYHLWTIQDAKDGDIIVTPYFIFIFKNVDKDGGVHYYCHWENRIKDLDYEEFDIACEDSLMGNVYGSSANYSPATKEQRNLLFTKMREAGYEWDAEKKELRKIKPHYDISNFKPFDKVLVRNSGAQHWRCGLYSHYRDGAEWPFIINDSSYKQCIPYEGNEHLLGTTDMPSEEFINW